jgi:hypothetical protein
LKSLHHDASLASRKCRRHFVRPAPLRYEWVKIVDLPHEVAGNKMPRRDLLKLRIFLKTFRLCIDAPGRKATAGLWIDRRGQFAFELDAFALMIDVGYGTALIRARV